MRRVLVILLLVVLAMVIGACGKSEKNPSVNSRSSRVLAAAEKQIPASAVLGDEDDDDVNDKIRPGIALDKDLDQDNDKVEEAGAKGYFDGDDGILRYFGHPASAAEWQAITTLVDAYFAAAAAEDGGRICALTYRRLAKYIIPEDEGHNTGPAFLRGLNTCVAIMTLFSKHLHSELVAKVKVMDIRVKGNEAKIMLGSTVNPASYTSAKREAGTWKIAQVFSIPTP